MKQSKCRADMRMNGYLWFGGGSMRVWGQQVLGFKSGSSLKFETNGEIHDFPSLSLSGLISPTFE